MLEATQIAVGDLLERFQRRIEVADNGCWLWTGPLYGYGYGSAGVNGRTHNAHRAVWETAVGPIEKGLHLDHLCRNPACVNPAHMEVVTARVNAMRSTAPTAVNARKTHCVRGHPLNGENLLVDPKNGKRRCRACADIYRAAHREKVRRLAAPVRSNKETHA